MNDIPNAVIKDPRPQIEKEKDHKHVSGAVQLTWKELDLNNLKLTSQRKQNGSFSCVKQSCASAIEKLTGKVISASSYFWRKNYPEQGMWLQDGGDLAYNRGDALEAVSPSQNQSEVVMNQVKQLTTTINATGYRQPAIKQIDLIAEAIEAYGQCVLTYESNSVEYNAVKFPYNAPIFNGQPITFGHAICGQMYGLYGGQKVIVCRDSAVESGVTIITEIFHQYRNTGALYFMGAKDVSVPQDTPQIQNLKQQVTILQALITAWTKLKALLGK